MMKKYHSSFCAGSAIAAALALVPTPSFAQIADPTITPVPVVQAFPPTLAPPAPQPVIVIPPELPEVTPPAEAVRAPEPAPAAATTMRTRATPRPAAAPVARSVPEPRVATPTASTEPTPTVAVDTVPVAPVAVAQEPLPTPATPREAPAEGSNSYLLLALAGLIALALAIWGFIAIGRRRPIARRALAETQQPPIVRAPEPQIVVRQPLPAASSVYNIRPAHPEPAASMAHTGASVALPRTMPATFEERDVLLKRMIAARPDRANPFTTYQARHKRARLILQSLGRDFSNTEPWIDFSQYPANWPELARSKYAAA